MQVFVNGGMQTVPTGSSVGDLVRHLGLADDQVAVELDLSVVRRHVWEHTPLGEGARVEIVRFVGGG